MGGTEWGKAYDRESLQTIEAALAAGVNFLDTADVPGNDLSEELLGQAIRVGAMGPRSARPASRRHP